MILTVNPSISYCLFELFKSTFAPGTLSLKTSLGKLRYHSPLEIFLFAAVSKSIASTITYPFILAKARMQVSSKKNLNPILVIYLIAKGEGWKVRSHMKELIIGSL